MQGISIFQQIYAPRVAHVVTDFDGISHNTHSPYAIGGVVGSTGKMTAIVANDQADTWHIVNLKCGNLFDAVAVLGAFDESEAANMAMRYHGQYFDAVCGDVCESNTGGLQRFLNHHFYMSTNRPVYAEELAKLQDIPSTQSILWDGVQLKSHNGSSKHLLLDMMRCDDDKALLEKMDFVEEESKLDGEIAEYDALVVEAYKLENTVSKLALAMDKATSISTLKVAKQTLSKPKTMRGFGVIQQLVSFELSDGQAVSIIFNVSDSEANASAKMTKDDLLVAWKYKLNSRDITAAVQPNATQNVSLNMIASRIMGLADANSEKFVAAQKKKDAMQTELADSNQQVKDLQSQEQLLIQEIADLQKQLDEKAKNAEKEAKSRAEIEGVGKDVQSAPQERPQRKVELAINGKSTLSANQSTDYGFTFIKDDFDKNKYRLLDADGKEYQVIWKSGATWTMMTGETFKTLAEAKQAAIDHALNRKETERQEKASRAEVEGIRTVKRKPVSVFVYWSESSLFTENTSYPFAEFEALAFAAAMKNTEGGYDKTKVKVTFDDGFVYSDIRVDLNTKETGFKSLVKSTLDYYKAKNIVNEDQQLLSTFDFSGVNPVVPVQPTIEPVAQVVEPTSQERPADYRTNLANARAVAKSLGIETKGKKLVDLLTEIDQKDTEPKATISNLSDDEYKAKEAKPLAPVEKAQQAKKDAFLNTEVDSAYGTVTKKQLLDNLINDGWTLSTGWTEDKAKGKALDTELDRLKRTAPWGNTSHPDTIRLNELKNLAKESPHKDYGRFFFKETVYHLESPTGKLKSLSKTELDYINDALAKKETQPVQPVSEPSKPLSDTVIKALLSEDAEAWYTDDYGDVKTIYSADEKDGFFVSISNESKKVDLTYTDWETDKKQNETFVADTISPDQVIDRIKAFIAKYEQNSVELSPVQTVSEPPMTNPDRDYLQSIIDGDVDPLTVDMDAVIALAEKYDGDAEITPLLDQALEVINQAEQEAAKGI